MTTAPADLALLVDAAARSVRGVTELYYATALPARLWRGVSGATDPFSNVRPRGDALEVTVSIGVSGARADEVARAVAAAVRNVVGETDARVTVRVSRVAAS